MTDYVNRMGISSTEPARSSSLAETVKNWLENYSAQTTPEGVTVIYANESGGDPVAYVYPADENGIVRVSVNGVDYFVFEDEIYPPLKTARREEIEIAGEAEEVPEEEILEPRPPEEQVCGNNNPDAFTPDTNPHHDYVRQMSVPDEELNSTQNSAKRFGDDVGYGIGNAPEEEFLESLDPPEIHYVYGRRYQEEESARESAVVVEERLPDVQPDVQPAQAQTVAVEESRPVADPPDIVPSEIDAPHGTEFDGAETRTVTENVVGSESAPAPMPAYTTDEIALAPMSAYPDETVTTLSAMSLDPSMAVDQASFAATEPSIASAVICYQQPLVFVGSGDHLTPSSLTLVARTTAKADGEKRDGKLSLDRASQSQSDSKKAVVAADGARSDVLRSSDGVLRQAQDPALRQAHDKTFRQAQDSVKPETGRERAASKNAFGEKIHPDANLDSERIAAAAPQGAPFVMASPEKGSAQAEKTHKDEQVTRASPDEQGDRRGSEDSDGREKRDEWWFLDLEDPEDLENEELMYS